MNRTVDKIILWPIRTSASQITKRCDFCQKTEEFETELRQKKFNTKCRNFMLWKLSYKGKKTYENETYSIQHFWDWLICKWYMFKIF